MSDINLHENSGRLLAFGDIHGCVRPLRAILDALAIEPQDTVVILGDIINRGPATREVVETLLQLGQQCELVFVMGNHEEELLAARHDQSAFQRWLAMGGWETLRSYGSYTHDNAGSDRVTGSKALEAIPAEHWHFFEQSQGCWECDSFFFVHAGYDPDLPLQQQSSTELRWLALEDWPVRPHSSGKTAIVGHTPNLAGRVVDFGFLKCLDTGCGLGGFLTAMDVRHGHQWRCAEDSEKVIWE